jgi:putative ABC transport system permease protein
MLKNYLKLAFKVLRRRKFYTFISLFGISFTLLVLTIATAMMDHMLSASPPETKLDRILMISSVRFIGPQGSRGANPGYLFLDRHVRTLSGIEAMTMTSSRQVTSFVDDGKVESVLTRTDGSFWEIFDFDFVEGGPFLQTDEDDGNFVAVINEATRRRFFGNESAVDRDITLDFQVFRVVGVVRNVSRSRPMTFSDAWVPISTSKTSEYKHQLMGNFRGIVLAPSTDAMKAIQGEFAQQVAAIELPDPASYDTVIAGLDTLFEKISREMFSSEGDTRHPGKLRATLLFVALLFMLLPTINLVNINLSRILERGSEIGVRKAFGASSWVLVGQFVVENVVLTLIGGLLGYALSGVALAALNQSGLIPYSDFTLNLRIFGYGMSTAIVFGLLSGVYPAWKMSRLHPVEALRGRRS